PPGHRVGHRLGAPGRRGAGRGQGPRALPGDRRRAAPLRRCAGCARGTGALDMRPLTLTEVARMSGGTLHGADATIDAIATDTRRLPATGKALFVALRGENFDAHDHLDGSVADRVAGLLVSRPVHAGVPEIRVADTQLALAQLAAAMQRGRDTRVVAITGSNGKTSVKALLLSVLAEAFDRVHGNPGNYNNEIGLPLAV